MPDVRPADGRRRIIHTGWFCPAARFCDRSRPGLLGYRCRGQQGGRPGAAQAAHARQRQLPVAGGTEVSRRDPAPACCGDTGLQPAQPAVALLDRDDPPAAAALAALVAAVKS